MTVVLLLASMLVLPAARKTAPPKRERNSYHEVKEHTTKKGVHVQHHWQRNPNTKPKR